MDVPMVVMSKRIGFPIPKFTILMAINHQSVWVVYDIAVLTLSGLLTHGLLMSSGIPNYYLRSKTLLIIPSMLSKKKYIGITYRQTWQWTIHHRPYHQEVKVLATSGTAVVPGLHQVYHPSNPLTSTYHGEIQCKNKLGRIS